MNSREIDKLLQNYYDNYDNFVTVPDNISYGIESIMYNKKEINVILFIKKVIITILGICTLTGGIVFAKDYIFNSFKLGKGIDTAVNNGYIYNPIDNSTKIKNSSLQVSIDNFFMDDTNISSEFVFEFADELTQNLGGNNIKNIELSDLIITDENNTILYCANEEALMNFCNSNNLYYKFGEFNDNYMNGGLNSFISASSEANIINLTYNIYLGNLESSYPKSKHLLYKFSTIKLIENYESEANYKILEGNWEINIDVPENMYNRDFITYNVISCSDENIEVSCAKVFDTGFEFGCIIHNTEIPEHLKQFNYDISKKGLSSEERIEIYEKYAELGTFLPPVNSEYYTELGETIEDCTYVQNQNNKKFIISSNPGRKQREEFINNYSSFNLYETFDLTKYDITDELVIHLVFYGRQIEIKLEIKKR